MNAESTGAGRVLVVGGAGYVGNVLVRGLLAAGYGVRVLDRLLFDHGAALAGVFEEPGFSFVHGDLRDRATLEAALDGVDRRRPAGRPGRRPGLQALPGAGLEGQRRRGQARCSRPSTARGIDRFVFTSTCSNYGLRETEEPADRGVGAGAALALRRDQGRVRAARARARGKLADFCPTILRIATAYGLSPRMRFDLTISEFTRTLAIGEELVVYDADTWRPYCHVADISKAIRTVLDHGRGGRPRRGLQRRRTPTRTTRSGWSSTSSRSTSAARGRVEFSEGGADARNYRVSFEKIRVAARLRAGSAGAGDRRQPDRGDPRRRIRRRRRAPALLHQLRDPGVHVAEDGGGLRCGR